MAIAVKVDHRSPCRNVWLESHSSWLESHSCNESGGKGGSHPARSKLKNTAADPIRDKEIVRAVNSQTIWNYWNLIVFRGDSASQPRWGKLINGGAEDMVVIEAAIRHKQIAPAVKGQSKRIKQTRGKGGSRSARSKFIDVAAMLTPSPAPQTVACPVKGQSIWKTQARGKGGSHSGRSKFIDVRRRPPRSAHKQIARAVKGQANWTTQPGGKSGSHSSPG